MKTYQQTPTRTTQEVSACRKAINKAHFTVALLPTDSLQPPWCSLRLPLLLTPFLYLIIVPLGPSHLIFPSWVPFAHFLVLP